MSEVSMTTKIHASADTVWKIVGDFNGLPKFVSAIINSTVEGSGVGAVRTLALKDGGPPIVERLERLDEETRTLSYSIVHSPLPLEDYVATIEVKELSENRCELTWSSTFEPKGAPEAEAVKIVENIYAAAFEGLKKLIDG